MTIADNVVIQVLNTADQDSSLFDSEDFIGHEPSNTVGNASKQNVENVETEKCLENADHIDDDSDSSTRVQY